MRRILKYQIPAGPIDPYEAPTWDLKTYGKPVSAYTSAGVKAEYLTNNKKANTKLLRTYQKAQNLGIDTNKITGDQDANQKLIKEASKANMSAGGAGGQMMGGIAQGVGTATSLVSSIVPHKGGDDTNEAGQQAIGNALMSSGNPYAMAAGAVWNALSAVGSATGLNSNKLSEKQANKVGMNGGTKFANNLLSFIPMAGAFMGKTIGAEKSLEVDKVRGAFSGTADDIDTAGSMGGKRYVSTGDINDFIMKQNERNNMLTNISMTNTLRKQSDYGQDLQKQNFNKYSGQNYQSMSIGKQGMKLLSKAELLSIYKNGGKNKVKYPELSTILCDLVYLKTGKENLQIAGKLAEEEALRQKRSWDYLHESIDDSFGRDPEGVKQRVLNHINLYKDQLYTEFKDDEEALEAINTVNSDVLISKLAKKLNITKLQNGGSILIPEGALHKNKHHMDESNPELAEELTEKGIPVVITNDKGEIQQVAEIEQSEIILEKDLTDKVEKLWHKGDEEAMIECGKLITSTLFTNCDDNSNLIEETN